MEKTLTRWASEGKRGLQSYFHSVGKHIYTILKYLYKREKNRIENSDKIKTIKNSMHL